MVATRNTVLIRFEIRRYIAFGNFLWELAVFLKHMWKYFVLNIFFRVELVFSKY